MRAKLAGWLAVYGRRRIFAILLLGFSSGLPLALTASTLGIWLTEAQISKASIGLFAAISTPYAFKFLWSPLIDGVRLPLLTAFFGRRRAWLLATQALLVVAIAALGLADPAVDAWRTALFALLVAIASASQDIVIDAYRVESLPPEEQGAGAGAGVLGYRLGMIASSAGALFSAQAYGWQATYFIMAALMGVGIVTTLLSPEPQAVQNVQNKSGHSWLFEYVVEPFTDFMTHSHWLALLLFIMLYKFSDAFMGVMTNPFLIEIGFTKVEIGTVVKLFGLWATIFGSVAGGAMVFRLGIVRSLWICGFAHMLTNFMFVGQAWIGANVHYLALSITLENFSGGMGTAAFVAFISRLCNRHFTATQYALLSSVSAIGRTWLSTPAGGFAQVLGWEGFFFFASLLALPSLVLLHWLQRRLGSDLAN